MLSAAQGSHEWCGKQPKREGTFPLAESAVKRFPVTVIAAFGGIISVEAVGRGGNGWGGRERHGWGDFWSACREPATAASSQWEPGARHTAPAYSRAAGLWANVLDLPLPPNGWIPFSGVLVGAAHSSHAALALIPCVTLFLRLQSQ